MSRMRMTHGTRSSRGFGRLIRSRPPRDPAAGESAALPPQSAAFVAVGGGEPPILLLDGEQCSEFLLEDETVVAVLVQKLLARHAWLMLTPTGGDTGGWLVYVRLADSAFVADFIARTGVPFLSRGLHEKAER